MQAAPVARVLLVAAVGLSSTLFPKSADALVRAPRADASYGHDRYDSRDDDDRESRRDHDRDRHGYLYSCNVSFRARGEAVRIGLGFTDLHGHGEITCYDSLSAHPVRIPIQVDARGPGVGLGITALTMSAAATGIGISSSPESLLGRYAVVRADAAIGVGVGAAAGLKISRGNVSIDIAVNTETGLGAGVDLLWVDLKRDVDRSYEAPRLSERPSRSPGRSEGQVVWIDPRRPVMFVDQYGRPVRVSVEQPAL